MNNELRKKTKKEKISILNILCSKKQKVRLGFTLLEVLVASGIFATILMITTATVAEGSSYLSKVKALRETSEESRRLADIITADVRNANNRILAAATIGPNNTGACNTSAPAASIISYKSGVATIGSNNCFGHNLPLSVQTGATEYDQVMLVVSTKEEYIIYGSSRNATIGGQTVTGIFNRRIKHTDATNIPNDKITASILASVFNLNYLVTDINHYVTIDFGGYSSIDQNVGAGNYGQSIIKFLITSSTKDTSLRSSAKAIIRSAVTSRNYDYK